jgi:hypothetical protein
MIEGGGGRGGALAKDVTAMLICGAAITGWFGLLQE